MSSKHTAHNAPEPPPSPAVLGRLIPNPSPPPTPMVNNPAPPSTPTAGYARHAPGYGASGSSPIGAPQVFHSSSSFAVWAAHKMAAEGDEPPSACQ